jgi:hypothetical protein
VVVAVVVSVLICTEMIVVISGLICIETTVVVSGLICVETTVVVSVLFCVEVTVVVLTLSTVEISSTAGDVSTLDPGRKSMTGAKLMLGDELSLPRSWGYSAFQCNCGVGRIKHQRKSKCHDNSEEEESRYS